MNFNSVLSAMASPIMALSSFWMRLSATHLAYRQVDHAGFQAIAILPGAVPLSTGNLPLTVAAQLGQ